MKHARLIVILGGLCLSLILLVIIFLDRASGPQSVQVRAAEPASTPTSTNAAPTRALDLPQPALSARSILTNPKTGFVQPRIAGAWNQPVAEPEFARFVEWAKRYLAASPAGRRDLEPEGIQMARERRAALRNLIQSDPARALALAIPVGIRRVLPESISSLLEDRVSGRGSLDVFAALAEPGREKEVTPVFRTATVNDHEYEAYVYGRRLGEPTRRNIPLNGVAVDNQFAVNQSPLRLLEPEEAAGVDRGPTQPICGISGNPSTLTQSEQIAEVGGQTWFLCGPAHVTALEEKLTRAEAAGDTGGGGGEVAGSVSTEGIKRLLVIRVDFSDLTGAPFSDATGVSLVSGLNAFYSEMSFGRTGFYLSGSGSEVTPTVRMPQSSAFYGQNNYYNQLRSDARNAAAAAGYVLANYDYDVICFGAVPGWGWAGLGYVGAPGAWLRSYFTPGVAGHEIGHNYGLNHANFWDTGGQSIIGTGTSVEYGDIYDTMGSANAGPNHFNASYKKYLNWLQNAETLTVSASGVYRVYPHDDTNSTGLRGLRIVRSSSTTNYWVEFRSKFPGNRWFSSGAGIHWAGNGNEKSHLLDTTPGSPDGKNDAALVIGRTFSDYGAGIHITTLGKGGTTPESLDIAVNLGTFPGNQSPTVSLDAGATSAAVGAPINFTATASDPDGDSLAYSWDFGDATFGTNSPSASKSWSSAGEYVVRCVVSDLKGGQASKSVVVTVGSSTTYRISGQITAGGAPIEGVRVGVSPTKMSYTDSDGFYTIASLPAGTYTVTPVLDGYTFSASGFVNPVSVGPNATGIDFASGGGGGGSSATMTSPAQGSSYVAPASVFLAASATPGGGHTVIKVEFFEGANKVGEDTSSPFTFSWTGVAAASYTLTARSTDSGGLMATSAPVTITVSPVAPSITGQPQNRTVTAGGNVTFSVTASGGAPLAYQWRRDGVDLPGATSASLSLFNVQLDQAGAYSVVVSNGAGSVTSSTATLTVNCGYSLSASSATYSSAGGSGNVNVTAAAGCSWTVSGVPAWINVTAGNGGSGNGTVIYSVAANSTGSARNATLTIAGHSYAVSQEAPDLTPPTVAFSSPAANSASTNASITVTGTANDNNGVALVECRVGAGSFSAASGTTSWNIQLSLLPGTNQISARSTDLSGNVSAITARSVFCASPGTLSLGIHGRGSVKGGTNGQRLDIGRQYKLTALPSTGFVFSNWSGDISTTLPDVTFIMQSNLTLTANFVTNPFAGVRGAFHGLFYDTNAVQLDGSGFFTLSLSDRGAYTASLRIGARKHSAAGKLDLAGKATNQIARPGTNGLTVTWAVQMDGSDQVTGTVGDNAHWTADILGDRAVFSPTNPAPQAGSYTAVLLGNPGSPLAPGGDSYATLKVNPRGGVTLKATLADKSALSAKAPISKNGHWPLYSPLYGGKGAILAWVTFADQPGTDLDGTVSWIKPALTSALYYPAGFNTEAALLGSRYLRPTNAPILNLVAGVLTLEGGNLSAPFSDDLTLDASSKITNLGPDAVTLTFSLSQGLFSGRLTPAGGGAKPIVVKGVVLQKSTFASGHFLGTNESGRVLFQESGGGN